MFLNPVMLAGLGGAVLPLVLHFLSRSRFRTVEWGGMMFLQPGDSRQRLAPRLRQWLLLLLRMGIVSLLAVALARPVVAGRWGNPPPGVHRLAVLVVDCSASMGTEEAGRSRLDLARETALRLLSRLHRGDEAALLVMGDPGAESDPRPTTDLQAVASRLSDLAPVAAEADAADALSAALDLCERAGRAEQLQREIYLLCDRQACTWDSVNDAFARAWRQRWSSARRDTRLYVLPVGGTSVENVAVESVELANPPAIRGQPADVDIRVHNFGRQSQSAVPVTLSLGKQDLFATAVNLDPGATETVRATVKFPAAGSEVVTASVKTADMPSDNRLDSSLAVLDPLRVLIISGDQRPGAFRSDSDFLRLALAPFPADRPDAANLASVTLAAPDQPSLAGSLAAYQVVILANVTDLPDPALRQLEQFVYAGGGLLMAPGSLARIDRFNQAFFRNGAGLMPAQLSPATPADASLSTSILGLTLDHPAFRFLKGSPNPIPAASIVRYFPASPREGDSRVLGSYATGDPFLIEGTFGRGRVLLVTTSLSADWSTLPLTSFYLPFVQSSARYLAGGNTSSRNLRPGQPITLTLDQPVDDKSIRLLGPDSREVSALTVSYFGPQLEIRCTDTARAGDYVLAYRAGSDERRVHFIVQPPIAESDPMPLSDDAWDRLRRAIGFEQLADEPGGPPGAVLAALDEFRRELSTLLILAVVALLLAETAVARTWSARGG